jgi:hypothetical protein
VPNGICTTLQAEVEAASSEAEALAAQHGFSDADAADILSDMAAAQAADSAPSASEPQQQQPGSEQSQIVSGTADSTPAAAEHISQEPPAGAAHEHDDAEGAVDGAAAAPHDDAGDAVPGLPPDADPAPAGDTEPGEVAPQDAEGPAEVHVAVDDLTHDGGGIGNTATAEGHGGTDGVPPGAEVLQPE